MKMKMLPSAFKRRTGKTVITPSEGQQEERRDMASERFCADTGRLDAAAGVQTHNYVMKRHHRLYMLDMNHSSITILGVGARGCANCASFITRIFYFAN